MLVGSKPAINYVLAVATQFNAGAPEVRIRARGSAILNAINAEQLGRRTRLAIFNLRPSVITLGTEEVTDKTGKPAKVSTIEIMLQR